MLSRSHLVNHRFTKLIHNQETENNYFIKHPESSKVIFQPMVLRLLKRQNHKARSEYLLNVPIGCGAEFQKKGACNLLVKFYKF
jgi:hypothetical protein